MSFRSTLKLAAASALILALAAGGCSFRKNPPDATQYDLKTGQLGCLDKAGVQMQLFFQGKASEDDVNAIWNCASKSLAEFSTRTHGSVSGAFTANEIRKFLARYFIHQLPLTDALTSQVGQLKQALVGGSPNLVTRDEIDRTLRIFEVFRRESLKLRTFMPLTRQQSDDHWSGIGGMRWREISSNYLDELQSVVLEAASDLGSALSENATPYGFVQLDSLVLAFLDAIPKTSEYQDTRDALSSFHNHMDLMSHAKGTLLIPDTTVLSDGSDWDELLETGAKWGLIAVRLAWWMDNDRLSHAGGNRLLGEELQSLRRIVEDTLSVLGLAADRHPNGLIAFDELQSLVMSLPKDMLPARPESINVTLRPLVRRIIGGTDPGPDGRAAEGITLGVLRNLQDSFNNWYEGQHLLETLFKRIQQQDGDAPGTAYVRETLLNSGPAAKLWNEIYEHITPEWNSNTVLAARRIESLIRALRPLFKDNDNEISFPPYSQGLRYSLHDLSELNWMQSLSRLLVRGYVGPDAQDGSRAISPRANVDQIAAAPDSKTPMGLSFKEFDQFFSDFRQFGIDIKFFDPDDKTSSSKRFREGDVFTYVSDGNGYLDLNETTALLGFAISTLRKASRVHHDIAQRCPLKMKEVPVLDPVTGQPVIDPATHQPKTQSVPDLDKYGEVQIVDDCYRTLFFSQMQNYWSGMDEMIRYYGNLTWLQQDHFRYLLEVSGRKQGYQLGVAFNSDDTQGMIAALQYIEGIFSRYDVADTGKLGPADAHVAFPVFKRTLQQMARCEDPPETLTDDQTDLVFTYILAKGKVPKGSWSVISWAIEKELPGLGNFKADRMRILEIFEAISENSHRAASNSACSTY